MLSIPSDSNTKNSTRNVKTPQTQPPPWSNADEASSQQTQQTEYKNNRTAQPNDDLDFFYNLLTSRSSFQAKSYSSSSKKNKFLSASFRYNATQDLQKLSSASSKGAVHGVIASLRRNISLMKQSDASDEEIQAAVRKMKRIIKKAQFKLGLLRREQVTEQQRRLAAAAENRKQELKLREEQVKQRRCRKSLDQFILDSEDYGQNVQNEYYKSLYRDSQNQTPSVPNASIPAGSCVSPDNAMLISASSTMSAITAAASTSSGSAALLSAAAVTSSVDITI